MRAKTLQRISAGLLCPVTLVLLSCAVAKAAPPVIQHESDRHGERHFVRRRRVRNHRRGA